MYEHAYQHLLIETTTDGVRTITLNRPERLNAVNPQLAAEFPEAMQAAAADDDVRAVIITGAGRAFCAGLDLSDAPSLDGSTRAKRLDGLLWVGHWVQSVTQCEKPVIAAINGVAIGAGFGLTLACDFRLMQANAKCAAGYIRRGLSPDTGVTWWLPRLVGQARATDIILTGRDVNADEAERIGLVTRVIADDMFVASVLTFAQQLASGPPIAMALSKRLLQESASVSLNAQLQNEVTHIKTCIATDDVQHALVAFREKRPPIFKGR